MSEHSYEELRTELVEARRALDSRERRLRELGVTDWEPKPPEKVVIKTCRHVKENGWCCGSPAVSDRDYCHFHLTIRGRRLKMARARARGERCCVELPPLEDLYAVQLGIQHVLDALLSGQLDRHLGGVVLYGLQQAASNVRLPQEEWDQSARFNRIGKTTWRGFEKAHGLPQDLDLDTPPDEAFPPPATSPGTTALAGEDRVTEDDIELEDLAARDPAACKRRALQLARKYRRRLRHEEDKLARACRILEAARRNEDAQKREPSTVGTAASPDSSAEAVSPEPDTASPARADPLPLGTEEAASGGGSKKSPQGEAIKKDEGAEDAS
jgi:hypothetical protein